MRIQKYNVSIFELFIINEKSQSFILEISNLLIYYLFLNIKFYYINDKKLTISYVFPSMSLLPFNDT